MENARSEKWNDATDRLDAQSAQVPPTVSSIFSPDKHAAFHGLTEDSIKVFANLKTVLPAAKFVEMEEVLLNFITKKITREEYRAQYHEIKKHILLPSSPTTSVSPALFAAVAPLLVNRAAGLALAAPTTPCAPQTAIAETPVATQVPATEVTSQLCEEPVAAASSSAVAAPTHSPWLHTMSASPEISRVFYSSRGTPVARSAGAVTKTTASSGFNVAVPSITPKACYKSFVNARESLRSEKVRQARSEITLVQYMLGWERVVPSIEKRFKFAVNIDRFIHGTVSSSEFLTEFFATVDSLTEEELRELGVNANNHLIDMFERHGSDNEGQHTGVSWQPEYIDFKDLTTMRKLVNAFEGKL